MSDRTPGIRSSMKSIDGKPESAPADGEDTTAASPEAEEATPESPEAKAAEEGAESEEDHAEGGKSKPKPVEVEEFEIFLEGEDDGGEDISKLPEKERNQAFARARKGEAEAKAEAERLKRELAARSAPAGAPDPGERPKSEDFAFDDDKFVAAVLEWDKKKAAHETWKGQQAQQAEVRKQEGQALLAKFNTQRLALSKRVPGYVEAEAHVVRTMAGDAQDVILEYADDPARVIYYLGRTPAMLEKFMKIPEKGRFIKELGQLEAKLMEKKKTQAPPPEETPRGSGKGRSGDSTLDKLREKAARTNDFREVNAYKREQKRKADAARNGQRK